MPHIVQPRALFFAVLALALAVRIVLAARLPVTGDEAYFYQWGVAPDFGFWDHPPMVGWWIAAMLNLSHAPWSIRLPATLLLGAVALLTVHLARPAGEARAYLAGLAVMLTPPELLNVLITTDTPLVLFSLLSIAAYARALPGNAARWYALAGALLGLAALSKYFAALLGFAYLVFALASPRAEQRWRGLAIVYACALPFVLVNLAWNWQHCWANILFNFFTRHGDAGFAWHRPVLFVVTLVYATSLLALVQLARTRGWLRTLLATPHSRLLAICAGVPFALFALLSLAKTIGLHWLFSFVPIAFAAFAFVLTREQWTRSAIFLGALSALHLAALAAIAVLPIETWARLKAYDGIVMTAKAKEVIERLESSGSDFVLAAEGYSPAATLSYAAGRYIPVFGQGSSHARHDDLRFDMRTLAGRDIAIFRRTEPPKSDYEPYFERVQYTSFVLHGVTFHVVLGRGFRFAPYRDTVLAAVRDRIYQIPGFLPQGACFFCEKYFAAPSCPVRL
jgi:hypothetical protein